MRYSRSGKRLLKPVAITLDLITDERSWFRKLVSCEQCAVHRYKRSRIFRDFVIQSGRIHRPVHRVIVVQSKGKHLEGNPDTIYKRKVTDYFEKVGKKVTWQKLGEGFADHVFRFQILDQAQLGGRDWSDELRRILANGSE